LEELDAYRMKSKIEQVLMGLGFRTQDMQRQTDEFSGRLANAHRSCKSFCFRNPTFSSSMNLPIISTLNSLQWLEEYLQHYNGTIILVFTRPRVSGRPDRLKTIALSAGHFDIYRRNYSFFEKERLVRKRIY